MGNSNDDKTKSAARSSAQQNVLSTPPKLARRKLNKHSTIRSGRTIGERRERLETKNERMAARKKDKRKAIRRIIATVLGFIVLGGIIIYLCFFLFKEGQQKMSDEPPTSIEGAGNNENPLFPTIEVIDEDATNESKISGRMSEYIALAEQDFRDLGYTPLKAVIPTGAIREVDFYLEGISGFIKTTIDRASAVTVEDADRMIRYLAEQGVSDFSYIDVRIDRRAYWQ